MTVENWTAAHPVLQVLTLLGASLLASVAAAADKPDTRLFEMRVYYAAPGKLDALNARFRDHTVKLFAKHGMTNLGYFVPTNNTENKLIYFTYSKPQPGGDSKMSATTVMRARLEGNQLTDIRDIFTALPFVATQYHFGSRMEFGRDGYLYVTVGERGKQEEFPQVLDKAHGKVHRITDNGDIPSDNPFFSQPGAVQSIWSYGHRNPQGLAFSPATGDLWEHEHGPRGGDELNVVQPGKNYGWPVVSYGTHYDGRSFTDKTAVEGIESPVTYWVPSIAPCGMAFVTGDRYPAWKGNLLVGSLSFRFVNRCVLDGRKVVKQENLFNDVGRVRAIAMGSDGYIYFSVENPGYIFRVVPVK